jgi:hypothetical protein
MELRERIKNEFDAETLKTILVPEWGEDGQPLEVCSKPLTLAELSQIQKWAGDDEVLLSVYTVIFKALDSDGNRLFKMADKTFLMNGANPAVVGRLANWILGGAGSAKSAAAK